MIKNKISPDLEERFKYEIEKSIENGKERGFFLCLDEKDKIFPSESSEGDEDTIYISNIRDCKGKVEGNFHVHNYISHMRKDYVLFRKEIDKEYEKKHKQLSNETIRKVLKKVMGKRLKPSSPSERDLLVAAIHKCNGLTNGTVCIGSDMEKNRVECWTIINEFMTKKTCNKVKETYESRYNEIEKGSSPSKFTKRLFLREIINLRY